MTDGQSGKSSTAQWGLWTATSLVVGNMVGSGVFLLPATLATYGSLSLAGWVFSSIAAFLLARIFSRLGRIMPKADGGPYAYAREGMGDFAGFLISWGYWISVWVTNAAITVSLVSALSTFFPALSTNSSAAILTGLSAVWLLTWINTRGVVASGRVQLVTTIMKLIPLIFIAVIGLFFMKASHFLPLKSPDSSAWLVITETTALTFFAFLGIECATIPAGAVKNPSVNIPKATMYGFFITTAIYILSSVAVMGVLPQEQLRNSVTPFADAATVISGSYSRYFVSGGVALAAFGALNGWILIQGQVPFAAATDRLFPGRFAQTNRRNVPAFGIIISSILASSLLAMNYSRSLGEQFRFLLLLTTVTVLVPYIFSAASYVLLTHRKGESFRSGLPKAIMGLLAFAFCLWMLAGSGKDVVYWGFLLLLAGIPLYVWQKINTQSSLPPDQESHLNK